MLIGRGAHSLFWRAVAFALVLEAMLVPAILYWPDFQEHIDKIRALIPIPVVRDMVDGFQEGGVAGYVAGQHFFKGCNTLGVAAAVLFAMGAIAGEAQRGTLEIWLARPFSRRRLLLERWLQGAAALSLPVFVTTWTVPWLLTYIEQSLDYGPLTLCAAYQSLFLLAVYSMTFLLSCIGRRPTLVAFVMLFFTTFQFAVYLVEKLTHFSLFRLTDVFTYVEIYNTGEVPLAATGALLATVALSILASIAVVGRRVP